MRRFLLKNLKNLKDLKFQMPPMSQSPQDPYIKGDMTNVEIRDAFRVMRKLMTTQDHVVSNDVVAQANLGVGPQPNTSTLFPRIRDFLKMNPPTFHVTKVDKHCHDP